MNDNEVMLTVPEVAKMLRVSVNTVWRMESENQLPAIRVRGSVRFSREAILRWIETMQRKAEAQCVAA